MGSDLEVIHMPNAEAIQREYVNEYLENPFNYYLENSSPPLSFFSIEYRKNDKS